MVCKLLDPSLMEWNAIERGEKLLNGVKYCGMECSGVECDAIEGS